MSGDVLVYDDDCGFCTWWADYFGHRADLKLVGFGELTDDQRERLPDEFETCAHLLTDETVYSCGAAAEQVLVRADIPPGAEELVQFFRQFEDYERLRERLYRELADRRELWGQFISTDAPRRT
jgi:predicted DCC family thiol-disulfide oxidoreductase YuxK